MAGPGVAVVVVAAVRGTCFCIGGGRILAAGQHAVDKWKSRQARIESMQANTIYL